MPFTVCHGGNKGSSCLLCISKFFRCSHALALISTQTRQDTWSGETGSSKDEHMLMVLAQIMFFIFCLGNGLHSALPPVSGGRWHLGGDRVEPRRALWFVVGLKPRILFKPRVWGTHVNPWLIHVNVWQKPLRYCKVISLQLIKNIYIYIYIYNK